MPHRRRSVPWDWTLRCSRVQSNDEHCLLRDSVTLLRHPMAYPPGTSIRSACICSHHHRRKSAHYLGVCMRRQNVMLPKFLIKLFENIEYYCRNIISKKKCSSKRNGSEYKTKFCKKKMQCSKNNEKWSRKIFKYF